MPIITNWEPPRELRREEIVRNSEEILALADLPISRRDFTFRINVLGLDWDIGGRVYQPEDAARIPTGADGKKIGVFLLHGGGGDHRSQEPLGTLLASKLGYRVATMTYPGHLYFPDPNFNWPGDTINPDGSARTPLWQIDRPTTPDQYELVQDRSNPVLRAKYGSLFFLKAREGSEFYDRLASWPMAFEEAMIEVCRRNFPPAKFSIYMHGHSTGGPFAHMLLQRVENIAGLVGMESSPYGAIFSTMLNQGWDYSFNYITVRTWRDIARYAGPEAGPEGMWRLPWLMEEVLEEWEKRKHLPCIKAQHFVQFAAFPALREAALASARRLAMNAEETAALVERFVGYPRELAGSGVKPVPPLLYGITSGSRDHTQHRYENILLPMLAAMNPAPKARVVLFQAGVHGYMKPEADLPKGIGPAIARFWDEAIRGGYYLPE